MKMPVEPTAAERILALALSGIKRIESGTETLDDFLDFQLGEEAIYRRTLTDLLMHFYRRRRGLERILHTFCNKRPDQDLERVLLVVGAQIMFQSGIAPESAINVAVEYLKKRFDVKVANFGNAVLRRWLCEGESILSKLAPADYLPENILKRWRKRYSKAEVNCLGELFICGRRGVSYRILPGRMVPRESWESVVAKDFASEYEFRHCCGTSGEWEIIYNRLQSGEIYVQDPATSLAPSGLPVVISGRVLELCAAPGGKSLMIAERLCDGSLTTVDNTEKRLDRLRQNLNTYGVSANIICADAKDLTMIDGDFDVVVMDVPCSNTGVFCGRPDALWRFTEADLKRTAMEQWRILKSASTKVAVGGVLLYSTCSLEPEEDENLLADFLRISPGWELVWSRRLLPTPAYDGAYAALLRRCND